MCVCVSLCVCVCNFKFLYIIFRFIDPYIGHFQFSNVFKNSSCGCYYLFFADVLKNDYSFSNSICNFLNMFIQLLLLLFLCYVDPHNYGKANIQLEDSIDSLQIATNMFRKQRREAGKGWSSNFGIGRRANNSTPSTR